MITRAGPAFWDKRYGLWRVAEDDPDSDLYAESSQATTVIADIRAHSRELAGPYLQQPPVQPIRPVT